MRRRPFKKAIFFAAVFSLAVFYGANSAVAVERDSSFMDLKDIGIEFYGGWESKDASEGRNGLSKGGVYVLGASVDYKGFSVAFDHTGGDKENFSEINLGVGYGFEFADFEFGASYTRLEFTHDDTKDNEWAAEASYGGLPFVSVSVAYVYATEAEGSFVEIAASSDIPVFGRVTVSPYVLQAFDFGYITKENDGANNFQIGVEAGFEVKEGISILGHLNRSFKQKDIKEELKADSDVREAGTWGGVSIAFKK
ncbi:hypothetical protein [Candidatus Mycalebacterium sp.]